MGGVTYRSRKKNTKFSKAANLEHTTPLAGNSNG